MIRLTYQEINNLVNKKQTTFYISGIPEADCINTGKDEIYDYALKIDPNSAIVSKTYDELKLTRDFVKRPMSLVAVVLLFIYILAIDLLAVSVFGNTGALSFTTFVLLLAIIIPAAIIYPLSRKRVFLYQVIAYKVDALCDVIDGKMYLVQSLMVMAVATLASGFLAYYKEFNMTTALVAVLVINIVIFLYSTMIMTKVFHQGNSKKQFNHKEVTSEEKKEVKTHTKSEKKIKYKVNRQEFLNSQKKNKEQNKVNEDIEVITAKDVEINESTTELKEIAELINEINTAEITTKQYEIKPEDVEEQKTILIDHSVVREQDNFDDILTEMEEQVIDLSDEDETKI